jgi:hypothetical protein
MASGHGAFTCALCGRTFERAWSEAEADAETKQLFGVGSKEVPCSEVCDECFEEFMSWFTGGAA